MSSLNILNINEFVDMKRISKEIRLYRQEQNHECEDEGYKNLAIEIILSYVDDILPKERVLKYVENIKTSKSYSSRYESLLFLKKHTDAVRWFVSGEALNSVWFLILGLDDVGEKALSNLIHRRIEGSI